MLASTGPRWPPCSPSPVTSVRSLCRPPSGSSDREVEVVRLVARGAANKDVARALGITAKTVAHHVAHIYDKTGCRSRGDSPSSPSSTA